VRKPAIVRVRPDSAPAESGRSDAPGDTTPDAADAFHAEFRSEADVGSRASRGDAASLVRRAIGGLIDLAILGSIDAAVVYLTLRTLGLGPRDWEIVPLVPLVAFLLLLDGGYLTIFTAAGGQTIGKMSAGTRVVPAASRPGSAARVPLGSAVLRAAVYFVSALPVGLGFAPILFTADRRALHDRLADTLVVQA
jgi:uncharacterized RDD family membrane protein YckC